MATFNTAPMFTGIAGEALAATDYGRLLKFEDDGGEARVIKATALTDPIVGIYAENGAHADGDPVSFWALGNGGVVKCRAGEAIKAGDIVATGTDARVIGIGTTSALGTLANIPTGGMAIGFALETAAVNQVIPVMLQSLAGSA